MYYFTYIIYSPSLDRYYVGHCRNLVERLERHNRGNGATYTKRTKDWQLRFKKGFATRTEASRFEMAIKRKKSRKYVEQLILEQDSR